MGNVIGAVQTVGRGRMQKAVLDLKLDAQRLEADQVHVNGAGADLAAARHGDARLAETPDQGAEHRDAGAHLGDELVGRLPLVHRGGVDDERAAVCAVPLDDGAEAAHDLLHHGDVGDVRNVMDDGAAVSQKRGGHELERGVLRARHLHFAGERAGPLYDDDLFRHGIPFVSSLYYTDAAAAGLVAHERAGQPPRRKQIKPVKGQPVIEAMAPGRRMEKAICRA